MKQLHASHNYAQKHYHGLHFGISVFGTDWRIKHRLAGGTMTRLKDQDIKNIFKDETVLIFGNIYGHRDPEQQKKFNHPTTLRQKNIDFYYWDNPHIPHLLYHNPANPKGHKNWCRMVFNHTHRQSDAVRRSNQSIQRINEQLQHLSSGLIKTWRDLVPVWRDCKRRSMTALICPSGDKTFQHHYNITRSEWTNHWRTTLERLGYQVFVRPKPGRELRRAPHRLCDQLVRNNVGITVSNHSIVAVESMLAGVPAVVSGSNATGELGTPAEEFEQTGILRPVDTDQLIDWCEQLLLDDYHKSEVYNGTWH